MVVPAYNEGPAIRPCVERILAATSSQVEVLVVYDRPDDTTATPVAELAARDPRVRGVLNQVRRGPAGALKAGFHEARAEVVVVTMADGSDDVTQIDQRVRLVRKGCSWSPPPATIFQTGVPAGGGSPMWVSRKESHLVYA